MTLIPILQVDAALDAPVACSLTPTGYRDRTAQLSEIARRAATAREPIGRGARISFRDGADVELELRAAIAAEASCCSFLAMRLDRRDGALVLEVTGPAEAQPIIAELFA